MKVDGSDYQGNSAGSDKPTTVKGYLQSKRGDFAKVLPTGSMSADRFIESALLEFNKNPQLITCTHESIGRVLNTVAVYGLEIGSTLGEAFIIPYKTNNGTKTVAQFQIGYKGLMKLARRSGEIKSINVVTVHEKDAFEMTLGSHPEIIHMPDAWVDRGDIQGWYCVVELNTGGQHIGFISVIDAKKHRDEYSKAHNIKHDKNELSVWDMFFEAMAIKTLLIKVLKYCPLSVESTTAIHNAEMVNTGKQISEDYIQGECA